MRLNNVEILNVETVKKVVIYGGLNYECFKIKVEPSEFDNLKATIVTVDYIAIYDTCVSIFCNINDIGTQELISKARKMGIEVKFY